MTWLLPSRLQPAHPTVSGSWMLEAACPELLTLQAWLAERVESGSLLRHRWIEGRPRRSSSRLCSDGDGRCDVTGRPADRDVIRRCQHRRIAMRVLRRARLLVREE
ncbi:MAG: hypothetical protein D6725_12880 [Planctomycetota bacterium]|nr:MAG: hypothetical protein D6725_12880 [Planctomycetota bacterium]